MNNLNNLSNLGFVKNNPQNINKGYILLDRFSTDLAAGSVNGTQADIGGVRTVTDTNSKISVSGGKLSFAVGTVASTDRIYYTDVTRVGGVIIMGTINVSTSSGCYLGFDVNSTGPITSALILDASSAVKFYINGVRTDSGSLYSLNTDYKLCVVSRVTGCHFFIKGGTEYPKWTLVYADYSTTGILRPAIASNNAASVFTADNLRIPSRLWLPSPIVSDSFDRANGALGSTDGSGTAETTGLGSGGAGFAWSDTLGTWAISSNLATCSATSGGKGFATVNSGKLDFNMDVVATRSAGVAGMVLRYGDSNNYVIAYHDGTNAKLDKVVAGSTTSVISAAATYSASAVMRVIVSGTSFDLFYNNAKIGATATISDAGLQTGTQHGLYTTSTASTFNNFSQFARGTSNEYSILDRF